jgi:hypothetical protein
MGDGAMDALQSVPDLIEAARADANPLQQRIIAARGDTAGQAAPHDQAEELRGATVALEDLAIDTFSAFEARMQHHYKRGPFSRKLKAALLEAKQPDLADKLHQYYLAINVLKHGKGASHRELLGSPSTLIVMNAVGDDPAEDAPKAVGLVDVTAPGFFEGLIDMIRNAHTFLNAK